MQVKEREQQDMVCVICSVIIALGANCLQTTSAAERFKAVCDTSVRLSLSLLVNQWVSSKLNVRSHLCVFLGLNEVSEIRTRYGNEIQLLTLRIIKLFNVEDPPLFSRALPPLGGDFCLFHHAMSENFHFHWFQ